MLYTKKGDDGKTNIFGRGQKISKSSSIVEALGALDELNSYLGVIKCKFENHKVAGKSFRDIIHRIQNDLFMIQAEVAGADKKIKDDEVEYIEKIMNDVEKELLPLKTFLISGVNEISANSDLARALARKAERRVVAVSEEGAIKIDSQTLVFMNRLSSFLYALVRYFAKEVGAKDTPKY